MWKKSGMVIFIKPQKAILPTALSVHSQNLLKITIVEYMVSTISLERLKLYTFGGNADAKWILRQNKDETRNFFFLDVTS